MWKLSLAATACGGLIMASVSWAAEPIGAKRCGSCHPKIYDDWKKTAHARSMESLTEIQQRDPTCRVCHTLAPDRTDPALAGVQCESCHGAGSEYAPQAVMRIPRLARLLGLLEVSDGTCRACHEGVNSKLQPYDYRSLVESMSHQGVGGPRVP